MLDSLLSPLSMVSANGTDTTVFLTLLSFVLGYCVLYATFRELDLSRDNSGLVKQARHSFRAAIAMPLGIIVVLGLSYLSASGKDNVALNSNLIIGWYVVAVLISFITFRLFNGGCQSTRERSITGAVMGLLVSSCHYILHENALPHTNGQADGFHFIYVLITVALLVLGFNACNLVSRLAKRPGMLFYSHFTKPMMVTLCILVAHALPIETSNGDIISSSAQVHASGVIITFLMLAATLCSFYLLASGYYTTFIKRKLSSAHFESDRIDTRPLFWQTFVTIEAAVFVIMSLIVTAQWGYQLSKKSSISEVQLINARSIISGELHNIYDDIDTVRRAFDFEAFLNTPNDALTQARFRDFLGGFVQASEHYQYITVLGQSGLEVGRMEYNNGYPNLSLSKQANDRDFSLEIIQGAALKEDEYFVSPLTLSRRHGNLIVPLQPVLKVSAPIVDMGTGLNIGVVVFAYRFDQLSTKLLTGNAGDGSLTLLSEFDRILLDLNRQGDWDYLRDVAAYEFIDTKSLLKESDTTTFYDGSGIFSYAPSLKSDHTNSDAFLTANYAIPNWKILIKSDYPWVPFYSWNGYLFILLFALGVSIAKMLSQSVATRLQHERQIDDLLNEIGYQKKALDEHAIVSVTDVKGNIVYANDKFCEISGYTQAELLGSNHRLVRSDEHDPDFFKTMWRTIANGEVWTGEIKNLRKDHSAYWVRATILPILNRQGKPERYIAVRTDITASKVIANVLEDSLRDAHQAAEAKNRFLANISHEIRTPMNAIIGLTDACLAVDNKANQRELIQKVNVSANNLLRIINDILDFSKMESGKLDIEQTSFSLQDVIEQYAYVHYNQAHKKQVELLIGVDSRVQDNLIGDPLRIGQVISNLVSNAIKFTQHGEVLLYVKHLQTVGDAVELEFAVRDSGIGMSDEQIERLFTPFTQADISTTRRFGGTGLGLSICKSLVSLMGGDIKVESTLGEGTVFSFTLFVKTDTEAPTLLSPKVQSVLNGRNTLVIECHSMRQQNYVRYLSAFGVQYDIASNVEEAKDKLMDAQVSYDYILVDCNIANSDPDRFFQVVSESPACRVLRHVFFVSQKDDLVIPENWQNDVSVLDRPVTQSMLLEHFLRHEDLESAAQEPELEHENQRQALQGLRLLVAEDNEINQLVLAEMLNLWGLEFKFANDGEQVVEMIQVERPDIVLMDVQMPQMDGYEATKAIRAIGGYFADVPIIAVTANNSHQDIKRARQAGMNGHVAKPISRANLFDVLNRYTGNENYVPQTSPKVQDEPSSTSLTDSIPELHVNEAIKRLGVDEDFYMQVLLSFADGVPHHAESLAKASQDANAKETAAIAHTIKGLAGTLGAKALSQIAAEIELSAKGDQILTTQVEQLIVDMELLAQKVQTVFAVPEAPIKAKDDAQRQKHSLSHKECHTLLELVESYDTKANSMAFDFLEQQRYTNIEEDLQEIYDLLSNYDYEKASDELKVLMERVE